MLWVPSDPQTAAVPRAHLERRPQRLCSGFRPSTELRSQTPGLTRRQQASTCRSLCRFGVLQKYVYPLVSRLQPCTDERLPPGGPSVPLHGLCGLSQLSSGSHRNLSAAPSRQHRRQARPATEAPAAGPAELDPPGLTWSLLQLSDTEGCRFLSVLRVC